jgi:hypothetical protein
VARFEESNANYSPRYTKRLLKPLSHHYYVSKFWPDRMDDPLIKQSSVEEVEMSQSKIRVVLAVLLTIALAFSFAVRNAEAQSQEIPSDVYYVGYFNLATAILPLLPSLRDNTLRIVNPGTSGPVCAAIYVLNSSQNMLSCCSCLLSADSMLSFSVARNLLGGSTKVGTGVIKVISTIELEGVCTKPSSANLTPVPELRGWITHFVDGNATTAEQQLLTSDLPSFELSNLESACGASGVSTCNCPSE